MIDAIRERWEQMISGFRNVATEERLDGKTPANGSKWKFEKRIVGVDFSGLAPGEVVYRGTDGYLYRRWERDTNGRLPVVIDTKAYATYSVANILVTSEADGSIGAAVELIPAGGAGLKHTITEITVNGRSGTMQLGDFTNKYIGAGLTFGPLQQNTAATAVSVDAAAGALEASKTYVVSARYYTE